MQRRLEREIDHLDRQLEDGLLSPQEYREELLDLERDYKEEMFASCQDAFDRERENW